MPLLWVSVEVYCWQYIQCFSSLFTSFLRCKTLENGIKMRQQHKHTARPYMGVPFQAENNVTATDTLIRHNLLQACQDM